MPTRFESYRMRDGVTPLAQDYFNTVFADIDTRIAELERQRVDLQAVVDELTKYGLQRIDVLVGPSMAAVNAMIDQVRQRRDELEAAIGHVGDLATKGDVATAKAEALAARIGSVNGLTGTAITLQPKHLRLGPANGPSAVTLTRDGSGRLTGVVSTVDGKPCTQVLTYDGAGNLTNVTTEYDGWRRVETMAYDGDGALQSVTAAESAI